MQNHLDKRKKKATLLYGLATGYRYDQQSIHLDFLWHFVVVDSLFL